MEWLVYFVLTSSIPLMFGQEHSEALFEKASLDVQHSEGMTEWVQSPTVNAPLDLMRTNVPDTSDKIREELVLQTIKEVEVLYQVNFPRWQYKRFNNADFILGAGVRKVALKKLEMDFDDLFVFALDDAVVNFVANPGTGVTDEAVFTRTVNGSEVLCVAILVDSAGKSSVLIYEIMGEKGLPVSVIELGIDPYSNLLADKVSFVHSKYGEFPVVLIDSPDVAQVTYEQKGRCALNRYIEVQYPAPVDIKTFTIDGYGYIAVANDTRCDIFKLDEFAQSHKLFNRLNIPNGDLMDLEYFKLGPHHYLVISGRNEQYLYVHKSEGFVLKQLFKGYGVHQIFSAVIQTCRKEVILFSIQDKVTEILLYNRKTDKFVRSGAAIPPTFRISPGSVASFIRNNSLVLVFSNHVARPSAFSIATCLQPVQNPLVVGEEVLKLRKSIKRGREISYESFGVCNGTNPCAWEVYTPFNHTVEQYVRSPCYCGSGTACMRHRDDISISSYVHICLPFEDY